MIKFLLYENAFDSISHGLEHLSLAEKNGDKRDYKYALLSIFQGTELLLKQLLCFKNVIYMFDKNSLFDNCIDSLNPTLEELFDCKSLEISKLCSTVKKQYPEVFKTSNLKKVEAVAKERNKIQHFGIQIEREEVKKLLIELYHQVISPAFKLIGNKVEDTHFDDILNEELEKIFCFYDIANRQDEILKISGSDYSRMYCHHCGQYSLFTFYDNKSYPVRFYCTSCNNKKDNISCEEFLLCPECGAPALLYDDSLEAGTCLWHRCANNKDGGIIVEMEYCEVCHEYKIEENCDCNINDEC